MKAKTMKWYRNHFGSEMPSSFVFHTEFDAVSNAVIITKIQEADETDALLGNLEGMMALIAAPGYVNMLYVKSYGNYSILLLH